MQAWGTGPRKEDKRMRIVLLEHPRPPSTVHFNDIANTPLWSCLMAGYAASSLIDAGFDVKIIDAKSLSFSETIKLVLETPSDLLAIHAVYFWEQTRQLFHMLSDLREEGYDGTICLFGFFPTLVWKDILEEVPEIDFIVVGEPEETIVELGKSLKAGVMPRCNGLAGRWDGKSTLFGRRHPITSLDRLPFPLRPALDNEETVSILASRGCYNGCSFCLIPTLDDGLAIWRGRSAANVAAEIALLVERGKRDFYFVDPNFVGPGKTGKKNAISLAHALAEFGLRFGMETRANDINDSVMRNLRAVGLSSMLLGIESGSSEVLKRLNKRTSVSQNERALSIVREVGIEPEIGFIMFEPGSSLEDIFENTRFVERNHLLDRLGRTANLLYHDQIALKGTPGYKTAVEQGLVIPEGIFGFEGRLLYRDYRVGWLANFMKPICQFVLRKMCDKKSGIYWREEALHANRFRTVNDHLVAIFKKSLDMAKKFKGEPRREWTDHVLRSALDELSETSNQYVPTALPED